MTNAVGEVTDLDTAGRDGGSSEAPPAGAAADGAVPARKSKSRWAGVNRRLLALNTGVFAVYLVFTLLLLGSTIAHPATQLPDLGDSLHNIWTWGDNLNRWGFSGRGFYEANIYFPEKHAGIFAELQVIHTLIFLPFLRVFDAPVLGYNFILVLAFSLSAFSVYLLAFELSQNRWAAFVAGTMFGFFTYRFEHAAHVQIVSFQWLVLPLLYMLRYVKDARARDLRVFFVFFLLQVVGIGYTTVYLWLFSVGWLLALLIAQRSAGLPFERSHGRLAAAMGVALVLSLPFYWPYLQGVKDGYQRGMGEFRAFAVDLAMLFSTGPENRLYGEITSGIREGLRGGVGGSVFPGFVSLGLTVFAIRRLLRERDTKPVSRGSVVFLMLAAGFFFLMLFGPVIKLKGADLVLSPAYLVYRYGFVFNSLRYVPNHAQPLMFALSLLTAMALAKTEAFSRLRRTIPLVLALFCAISIESASARGAALAPAWGADSPAVYRWLAKQTPRPILELPIEKVVSGADPHWYDQFVYMFYSVQHRMPLVNGISGFFPPQHRATLARLDSFPTTETVRWLRDQGVRFIVLHRLDRTGKLDEETKNASAALRKYVGPTIAYTDAGTDVFALPPQGEISGPDSSETLQKASTPAKDAALGFRALALKYPSTVHPGEKLPIQLTLDNAGSKAWTNDPRKGTADRVSVRIAIRNWVRESDGLVPKMPGTDVAVHARAALPQEVEPKAHVDVRMEANVPADLGSYQVRLNLVDSKDQVFPQPDLMLLVTVK